MGSIRKVTHQSGVLSWQARWRDPAGKQHNKNFEPNADAQKYLITVEGHELAGQYVVPAWERSSSANGLARRRLLVSAAGDPHGPATSPIYEVSSSRPSARCRSGRPDRSPSSYGSPSSIIGAMRRPPSGRLTRFSRAFSMRPWSPGFLRGPRVVVFGSLGWKETRCGSYPPERSPSSPT